MSEGRRAPAGPGQAGLAPIARIAAALLGNGQTTQATDLSVRRLAPGATLTVQWGELSVRSEDGATAAWAVAEPLSIDMGKVVAIETLVEAEAAGRLAADRIEAALAAIGRHPPVTVARFAAMAAAGAAALGIIVGATGAATLGLIAASAGLGALARRMTSHVFANPLAQPFVAALLAGLVGSAAALAALPVSLRFVAACPCMVLVPGPHVLNGMIDLVRARIPLGLARVAFASLVMLAICAGLLAGLALGPAGLPGAEAAGSVPLMLDVGAAGVAVAAYGSFFNMSWRLLPLPIAIGMTAHSLRWMSIAGGASLPIGAFAACCLVGIIVWPLAHALRLPFGAFAFAAVVSTMPGIFVFQAAADTVQLIAAPPADASAVTSSLLANAATAAVVLLAMVAGVIMPKLLFDAIIDRRHRDKAG